MRQVFSENLPYSAGPFAAGKFRMCRCSKKKGILWKPAVIFVHTTNMTRRTRPTTAPSIWMRMIWLALCRAVIGNVPSSDPEMSIRWYVTRCNWAVRINFFLYAHQKWNLHENQGIYGRQRQVICYAPRFGIYHVKKWAYRKLLVPTAHFFLSKCNKPKCTGRIQNNHSVSPR